MAVYTTRHIVLWSCSETDRMSVRLTGTCGDTVTRFDVDGLGTTTQNCFLITYEFGLVVEWCDRAETKPVPKPLCLPQMPHLLSWEWTGISAVTNCPLLAWVAASCAVVCGHVTRAERADHRLITLSVFAQLEHSGATHWALPAIVKQSSNGFPE